MGRPPMLTEERAQAILAAVQLGHKSLDHIAAAAGITYETLRLWRKRGEAALHGDPEAGIEPAQWPDDSHVDGRPVVPLAAAPEEQPYLAFFVSYTRARAAAVSNYLDVVRRSAEGGAVVREKRTVRPDGTEVVERELTRPDPRAAEWWLSRAHPEDFGARLEVKAAEDTEIILRFPEEAEEESELEEQEVRDA